MHKQTPKASNITTRHETEQERRTRPRSVCECGHTGDGPASEHLGIAPRAGHGACTVEGCDCQKFTWDHWLDGRPPFVRPMGGAMSRLLPHLTLELETELVNAVRESNDGYPQHLRDMHGWYDSITEEDIDAVSDALHEGDLDGAQSRADGAR